MYPVHLAPQAANSKISMKTSGAVHSRPRPMPHCMVGCCLLANLMASSQSNCQSIMKTSRQCLYLMLTNKRGYQTSQQTQATTTALPNQLSPGKGNYTAMQTNCMEAPPILPSCLVTIHSHLPSVGHFTFCISPFVQRNNYVYSQASRSKFILITTAIYMS